MRCELLVTSGSYTGTRMWLREGQTIQIGRTEYADLCVADDPLMSRVHFALDSDGGFIRIRDLGSRNGTYVNGQLVSVQWLNDGDMIVAGQTRFDIRLETSGDEPSSSYTPGSSVQGGQYSNPGHPSGSMTGAPGPGQPIQNPSGPGQQPMPGQVPGYPAPQQQAPGSTYGYMQPGMSPSSPGQPPSGQAPYSEPPSSVHSPSAPQQPGGPNSPVAPQTPASPHAPGQPQVPPTGPGMGSVPGSSHPGQPPHQGAPPNFSVQSPQGPDSNYQTPWGQSAPQQPGQFAPGQQPPGQQPPNQAAPNQATPNQAAPGQTPPGQTPQSNYPPVPYSPNNAASSPPASSQQGGYPAPGSTHGPNPYGPNSQSPNSQGPTSQGPTSQGQSPQNPVTPHGQEGMTEFVSGAPSQPGQPTVPPADNNPWPVAPHDSGFFNPNAPAGVPPQAGPNDPATPPSPPAGLPSSPVTPPSESDAADAEAENDSPFDFGDTTLPPPDDWTPDSAGASPFEAAPDNKGDSPFSAPGSRPMSDEEAIAYEDDSPIQIESDADADEDKDESSPLDSSFSAMQTLAGDLSSIDPSLSAFELPSQPTDPKAPPVPEAEVVDSKSPKVEEVESSEPASHPSDAPESKSDSDEPKKPPTPSSSLWDMRPKSAEPPSLKPKDSTANLVPKSVPSQKLPTQTIGNENRGLDNVSEFDESATFDAPNDESTLAYAALASVFANVAYVRKESERGLPIFKSHGSRSDAGDVAKSLCDRNQVYLTVNVDAANEETRELIDTHATRPGFTYLNSNLILLSRNDVLDMTQMLRSNWGNGAVTLFVAGLSKAKAGQAISKLIEFVAKQEHLRNELEAANTQSAARFFPGLDAIMLEDGEGWTIYLNPENPVTWIKLGMPCPPAAGGSSE